MSPPPPSSLPHEFHFGEIIGVRAWSVYRNRLRSIRGEPTDYAWEPKEIKFAKTHKQGLDCGRCPGRFAPCAFPLNMRTTFCCGLHAGNTFEHFSRDDLLGSYGGLDLERGRVALGLVRLFGRVIECATGWRAEKAEVHSLIDSEVACTSRLASLAETYAVPIISQGHARELLTPPFET